MFRSRSVLFGAILFLTICVPVYSAFAARIMVVPITGEIQLGRSPFVERTTREANEGNYDLIIYEINTFGGRLDAAVIIRDTIINSRVPTICFINKRAISAGVLISLAANKIYMHPNSTMGAAEPVSVGIGLGSQQETSEKVISYWRTELRATAEKNNRDGKIAEAFADKSIEIEDLTEEGKLLTLSTSQAIELGINFKVFALSVGPAFTFYKNAFGAGMVEGIIGGGAWNAKSSPGAKKFAAHYKQVSGEDMGNYWGSIYFYSAMQHFKQAIEKAGTLDQKKIRDVMAKEKFDTALGPFWYDKRQISVNHPGEIGQWQKGVFEVIDPGEKRTAPPRIKPAWPKK